MEWPIVNLPETIGSNNSPQYLTNLTTVVITKEIYSRAANACISDITINHVDNGLKQKVHTYLSNLQKIDMENWDNTSNSSSPSISITGITTTASNITESKNGYRKMACEFMDLMTFAASCSKHNGKNSNGRIIEICQGGLDAVHDLLKYRLPTGNTILAAKDAYILCSSLCTSSTVKLDTNTITGSRSPDIDYKFGLYTNDNGKGTSNTNVEQDDINKLYSSKACDYITKLHLAGQIETSSSSLAKYTLMSSDIVSKLTNKTFIVLGCDHPLSPTKSLLRIPNVTVIGIPQSWIGLDRIIEYVQYNSPDDTTFIYPTISSSNGATSGNRTKRNDGNLILSHGPHIVQWILDNTTRILSDDSSSKEHEFVLVPMPMMSLWSSLSSSYFPPELSVRYSASSDLIIQRLIGSIVGSAKAKISMWMYQSSTTCMIVPPASTTKSKELLSKRPSHEAWIHTLSMDTVLTPQFEVDTSVSNGNVDNDVSEEEEAVTTVADTGEEKKKTTTARVHNNNNHDYAIVNGIITSSSTIGGSCGGDSGGSHHVLAEMIRMWRCLIINLSHNHPNEGNIDGSYDSDEDSGDDDVTNATNQNYVHVFAPYVPILKNIYFFFTATNILEPNLKLFDVNVASSLMTAIGLAGLCDSLVNRPMPTIDDGYTSQYNSTPFSMFWNGSVHGGIWNCPYTLDSTLNGYTSYLLGKVYNYYDSINTTYNAYYGSTATAITTGTAAGTTTTAFTTDDSSELESQQQQQKQNNNETIIDHVPSKLLVLEDGNSDEQPPMNETMPDCVRERLEIM